MSSILGDCEAIRALRAQIDTLGKLGSDAPTTLICGETGVGKTFVARAIHRARFGDDAPWVEVSCAAIPATLIEAELFGYERSAFTDAKQAKPGLFEAAAGGTLFLDEIGELPLELQAKLLSVVESRRVRRLGAIREREVSAALVCATNVDLPVAVRDGRFRADLYHRLAVYTVSIPPLRERGGDVLMLARRFLELAAARYRKPVRGFTPEAELRIVNAPWPGNVRELSFTIERAVLTLREDETQVSASELFPTPAAPLVQEAPRVAPPPPMRRARVSVRSGQHVEVELPPGGVAFAALEKAILSEALRITGGNVVRAAKLLSLRRDAVRYRMRRLGLVNDQVGDAPGEDPEADEVDTVDIDYAG